MNVPPSSKRRVVALVVAVALGVAAAATGFAVFLTTSTSRLLPIVLVPAGLLATGAFLASYSTRTIRAAWFALAPALFMPALVVGSLTREGRPEFAWLVIAAWTIVLGVAAGALGRKVRTQQDKRSKSP